MLQQGNSVKWKLQQRPTDYNPHSPSPCAAQGGGGREIRSEVERGKKRGVGGKCFKIVISHYPTLILLAIK